MSVACEAFGNQSARDPRADNQDFAAKAFGNLVYSARCCGIPRGPRCPQIGLVCIITINRDGALAAIGPTGAVPV
jgi:hypothetical protein